MVLYDLSSLRFRRVGGSVTLVSEPGEEIATLDDAPENARQAASAVLEEAAARARVWRNDVACRVGFYHPQTGQVSIGAWPRGTVYSSHRPVKVSRSGSEAVLVSGVLFCGGEAMEPDDGVDMLRLTRLSQH